MNYLISFCLCVAGTVLTALANGENVHWLLISDANVLLWLVLAYALDTKRSVVVFSVK